MGIAVINAPDAFDRVFLRDLNISQSPVRNINDTPAYTVSFSYRRYRVVDAEGNTEYHPDADSDYIENYYDLAIGEYMAGQGTLMNALAGNQAAISKLINDNTALITEVVA